MPAIKDVVVSTTTTSQFTGGSTNYVVEKPNGDLYVFLTTGLNNIVYHKSTDHGITWGNPVGILTAGGAVAVAVWYDRWSGISGDVIHIAYIETTNDNVEYRSLDASTDTLSASPVVILSGTSTAAGGALSITRARGGNIGVLYCIDAGAEHGFAVSTDAGATFTGKNSATEAATTDQWILLPGWGADNQDLMCFFWDASANEISRKLFDDSANSWAETSIATLFYDTLASTLWANWAAAVDLTNSVNVLIAWNEDNLTGARFTCWTVTESAITAKTDVIASSGGWQGFAGLAIDTVTEQWWAFYLGDGTSAESFPIGNIYAKISADSGTTWGPQFKWTAYASASAPSVSALFICPRFYRSKCPSVLWYDNNSTTFDQMRFCCGVGGAANARIGV